MTSVNVGHAATRVMLEHSSMLRLSWQLHDIIAARLLPEAVLQLQHSRLSLPKIFNCSKFSGLEWTSLAGVAMLEKDTTCFGLDSQSTQQQADG